MTVPSPDDTGKILGDLNLRIYCHAMAPSFTADTLATRLVYFDIFSRRLQSFQLVSIKWLPICSWCNPMDITIKTTAMVSIHGKMRYTVYWLYH